MNWIEITDVDGESQIINLDKVIRICEQEKFRITDNDVAHPDGTMVQIVFDYGSSIMANWTLKDMREIVLHHRLGKKLP